MITKIVIAKIVGIKKIDPYILYSENLSKFQLGTNKTIQLNLTMTLYLAWNILNAVNVPPYNFIICERLVVWEMFMNFWEGTKVKGLYQVPFNHVFTQVTFTTIFEFSEMKWAPFLINNIIMKLNSRGQSGHSALEVAIPIFIYIGMATSFFQIPATTVTIIPKDIK